MAGEAMVVSVAASNVASSVIVSPVKALISFAAWAWS